METYSIANEQQVEQLLSLVYQYGLDYPAALDKLTVGEITGMYDGVGPAEWSFKKREALTQAFSIYAPCVMIHDICTCLGTISPKLSNAMLFSNLIKTWASVFGPFRWLKPAAWIERFKIIPILYENITGRTL